LVRTWAGGEVALSSAAVLAKRCAAALRLHVVEPLHSYQRISHPLTSPYTLSEIVHKTGTRLQALAASPEFAGLAIEYEVRKGKPFVELIIAARAWLTDLIVVGDSSQTEEPFSARYNRPDCAQAPGTRYGGEKKPEG
jgi:nucleotide-binding universal stress UspA family protein